MDINLDPVTSGATTFVSDMTATEILKKAEADRSAAEGIRQEIEGAQIMTLSNLIDKVSTTLERIERAANEIEVMLEVSQENATQIKAQAEEIQEIIEPSPKTAADTPAGLIPPPSSKRKLPSFLI